MLRHHALHNRRGLHQGYHSGPGGLSLLHGCDEHHWSWPLCSADSWALLPWKIWHLVPVSSDLPHPGGGSSFCPLLWGLQPSGVSLWPRRWLHWQLLPWSHPSGHRRNFRGAFTITSLLKWEKESELSVSKRNLLENSVPTKFQSTSHSLGNKLSIPYG